MKFAVQKNNVAVATTGKFSVTKEQADSFGVVYEEDDVLYVKVQGIKTTGEFMEKLKNSTKELLKKKFYLLSESNVNAEKNEDLLPQELLNDLRKARMAGIKKTYEVHFTSQDDKWFASLKPVNNAFFGGGQPQKERKLGDEQIAYIGMNTKNSKVGVITPAKTKRG